MPKHRAPYSLSRNVRRTLSLYWQIDRGSLIEYAVLIGVQVVASLLSLFFASRIIGELSQAVQGQQVSHSHVYLLLAASMGSILCERLAWQRISLVERRAWIKWYVRMTVDFNMAVSGFDMAQHHDHAFEKKLQKVRQEYQHTPQNFANRIMQGIHSCARLLSTLFVVCTFAPWLVPLMALSLLPGFFVEKRLSKLQWNLWGEKGDKPLLASRIIQYVQEKHRLQETKIFGTRHYLVGAIKHLHVDFYNRQLRYLRDAQIRLLGGIGSEVLVSAAITLWLLQKVLNGTLSLASYSFYSGVILQFGSSLGMIVRSLNFIYDNNEYIKDLYLILDTAPSLPQPGKPVRVPARGIPTVTFQNVSFRYPGSTAWALRNANFTIAPGDKVAFVGENGAGKTTIIKLLLRFYDPDKGVVLINNIDVRELDLPSYYHHIGVLFQYFNDYPFSVRDNIALGRVERFGDDRAVHRAARIADADKFISKYPKGYEQILEVGFKDGVEPSGGQWQRIALARALFRDAGILILDEPTAAVDAKSEYEIFKTLDAESKGKTTIIISHRFSTVRRAQTIFVMQQGKIVAQGTHADLMQQADGLYREMFDKQAEGYR